MIIPTDIKPELTTISMIRKGRKTTKPMMKAARNSERMKAGTRVVRETSAGVAGGVSLEILTMSASSSGRVLASMNCSSGTRANSNA